jgi:hypothetical protein
VKALLAAKYEKEVYVVDIRNLYNRLYIKTDTESKSIYDEEKNKLKKAIEKGSTILCSLDDSEHRYEHMFEVKYEKYSRILSQNILQRLVITKDGWIREYKCDKPEQVDFRLVLWSKQKVGAHQDLNEVSQQVEQKFGMNLTKYLSGVVLCKKPEVPKEPEPKVEEEVKQPKKEEKKKTK